MISTFDRVVDGEAEARGEFQDHFLRDVLLDERTGLPEQRHGGPLLRGIAKDADEDAGILEVAAKLNVVDADEAGVAHGNFAAESFADSALQKFTTALVSNMISTRKNLLLFNSERIRMTWNTRFSFDWFSFLCLLLNMLSMILSLSVQVYVY